jgi:hypothetical protein
MKKSSFFYEEKAYWLKSGVLYTEVFSLLFNGKQIRCSAYAPFKNIQQSDARFVTQRAFQDTLLNMYHHHP